MMMHIRLISLLLRRFHLDMSFNHWENAIHVYRFKPMGKNVKYAEVFFIGWNWDFGTDNKQSIWSVEHGYATFANLLQELLLLSG